MLPGRNGDIIIALPGAPAKFTKTAPGTPRTGAHSSDASPTTSTGGRNQPQCKEYLMAQPPKANLPWLGAFKHDCSA